MSYQDEITLEEELEHQGWVLNSKKKDYSYENNFDYVIESPEGIAFSVSDRFDHFGKNFKFRFAAFSEYQKRVLNKTHSVTYQSHSVFRRTARELLWALDRWAKEIKADEGSPWGWRGPQIITTRSGKKVYKRHSEDDPSIVWSQFTRDPPADIDHGPQCRICGRTSRISTKNRSCGNCVRYSTECTEMVTPEDLCDNWATECWLDGTFSKECLPEENRKT
jgi:hypothetical protein